MKFPEHFSEIKYRCTHFCFGSFFTFGISYKFSEELLYILVSPLIEGESILTKNGVERHLIFTDLTEAFHTHISVSFYFSFFLTLPLFIYQLWCFIKPGLYMHEKKALFPFLVGSPLLFSVGGLLSYKYILPLAWYFFITFEARGHQEVMSILLEPKLSEYISLCLYLFCIIGFLFQYPLILSALIMVGWIDQTWFIRHRKLFILCSFIIGALLSPPDPISQFVLALPLIFFYEVALLFFLFREGSVRFLSRLT